MVKNIALFLLVGFSSAFAQTYPPITTPSGQTNYYNNGGMVQFGASNPTPTLGTINTPTTLNYRCTGANDDQAISAAFSAYTSGAVSFTTYMLSGNCSIASTVTIPTAASGLTMTGEDKQSTTIQAAAGSNLQSMFQALSSTGTLQNFTWQNLVFDANYPNQTSTNFSEIFRFGGGQSFYKLKWQDVTFQGCGGAPCIILNTSGTATNFDFFHDTWQSSWCQGMQLYGVQYVSITDFTVYDMNKSVDSGGTCPVFGFISDSSPRAALTYTIGPGRAQNVTGNEFLIECLASTSSPCNGWTIHNITCYANAVGECGVSGPFDNSSIGEGYTIIDGNGGDRDGCECGGNNLRIVGFVLDNGVLSVVNNSTAYGSTGPSGILVADNTINLHGTPTQNGLYGIALSSVNHVKVVNNTIQTNYVGNTYSYDPIFVGFYGGIGFCNYCRIEGNKIFDLSATSVMQGIRLQESQTQFSTHVTILRNEIEGAATGLYFNSGTTYSTYVIACANDLTTTTTPINATPTNTGDSVANAQCSVF